MNYYVLIALMFLSFYTFAETCEPGNDGYDIETSWDAVTEDLFGNPINGAITYEIEIQKDGSDFESAITSETVQSFHICGPGAYTGTAKTLIDNVQLGETAGPIGMIVSPKPIENLQLRLTITINAMQ